jgi:hypothetical protein
MSENNSSFANFTAIEERVLSARLEGLRAAITHPGEKGRALEKTVAVLLRSFLPLQYGITTGFIAYLVDTQTGTEVRLSKQLDLITYDALRFAPLVALDTFDVLPLEAVLGYVAVKACLTNAPKAAEPPLTSIQRCVKDNQLLRLMQTRYYLTPLQPMVKVKALGIRAFLFAYEWAGDIGALAQATANAVNHFGVPAHFHGIYVAEKGFIHVNAVDAATAEAADYHHTFATHENGLLFLKTALSLSIASFPRAPANWHFAIDRYLAATQQWQQFHPLEINPP